MGYLYRTDFEIRKEEMSMVGNWSWPTMALYLFLMFYFYLTIRKLLESNNRFISLRNSGHQNKKYIYIILCSLIPTMIAAFRKIDATGLGGVDMFYVIQRFNLSTNFSFEGLDFFISRDNPLFYFLLYFIRIFTDNEKVLFFVLHFVIVITIYYFFREKYVGINSYAPLFFLMYYFLRSFSIFKFMLGLAFIAISFVLMSKGQRIKAIIVSLIASFIHTSLLFVTIMLLLYVFMEKIAKKKSYYIAMILVAYALIYILRDPLYAFFSQSEMRIYVNYDTSFMAHFTTILCGCISLLCFDKLEERNVDKFMMFTIFFDLACIPIQNTIGFFRLHYIFFLPRLYMWGQLISIAKEKIKPSQVEFISSVIVIAWTVFRFMREYQAAGLMPYLFDLF